MSEKSLFAMALTSGLSQMVFDLFGAIPARVFAVSAVSMLGTSNLIYLNAAPSPLFYL